MGRGFELVKEKDNKTSSENTEVNEIDKILSKTTEEYLLDRLSLSHCRITQEENEHIKKGRGSMYAYDVACEKGKSFNVFSPQLFGDYRVRIKGYNERLGNYIVLENGNTWMLFGHTLSGLEKGDIVDRGTRIGEIDKSGLSQNYHLHFEMWQDDYNISTKNYLEGKIVKNTEHTYALRKQRNWYIGEYEAMKFISDFEGFRECAYEDGKQVSIGYGTKAKSSSECITKEEAIKRKTGHIEMLFEHIYKNISFLENHNQRLSIASALYNLGKGSTIQNIEGMNQDQIEKHWRKFNKSPVCRTKKQIEAGVKTAVCKGLEKRRDIELKEFFKKRED
ncbi:MAG TPA: M23 family metallopeptidase [Candidatus Absconditabacterales bacterium]|nr:M23 family metallopeptidase [Candidatus Absconditabacterales bacterium]